MEPAAPDVHLADVETPSHIALVAELAKTIWTEHFVPIIGPAQVEYMLSKFQSEAAVARQIDTGYRYVIICSNGTPAGYAATIHPKGADDLQLSKFYVHSQFRRRGVGRAALLLIEQRARARFARTLWLTVNKNNSVAIRAYEKLGFTNAGSIVQDIGNGFVMDDYKMVKAL